MPYPWQDPEWAKVPEHERHILFNEVMKREPEYAGLPVEEKMALRTAAVGNAPPTPEWFQEDAPPPTPEWFQEDVPPPTLGERVSGALKGAVKWVGEKLPPVATDFPRAAERALEDFQARNAPSVFPPGGMQAAQEQELAEQVPQLAVQPGSPVQEASLRPAPTTNPVEEYVRGIANLLVGAPGNIRASFEDAIAGAVRALGGEQTAAALETHAERGRGNVAEFAREVAGGPPPLPMTPGKSLEGMSGGEALRAVLAKTLEPLVSSWPYLVAPMPGGLISKRLLSKLGPTGARVALTAAERAALAPVKKFLASSFGRMALDAGTFATVEAAGPASKGDWDEAGRRAIGVVEGFATLGATMHGFGKAVRFFKGLGVKEPRSVEIARDIYRIESPEARAQAFTDWINKVREEGGLPPSEAPALPQEALAAETMRKAGMTREQQITEAVSKLPTRPDYMKGAKVEQPQALDLAPRRGPELQDTIQAVREQLATEKAAGMEPLAEKARAEDAAKAENEAERLAAFREANAPASPEVKPLTGVSREAERRANKIVERNRRVSVRYETFLRLREKGWNRERAATAAFGPRWEQRLAEMEGPAPAPVAEPTVEQRAAELGEGLRTTPPAISPTVEKARERIPPAPEERPLAAPDEYPRLTQRDVEGQAADVARDLMLSTEETESVLELWRTRARAWSKAFGRPAEEWYGRTFARIERGTVAEQEARTAAAFGREEMHPTFKAEVEATAKRLNISFEEARAALEPHSRVAGIEQQFADGRTLVRFFRGANVKNFLHGTGHVFFNELPVEERLGLRRIYALKEGEAWTRNHEERFVLDFQEYLRTGEAPIAEAKTIFERFKIWLTELLRGQERNLNPELRNLYDRMLGKEEGAPEVLPEVPQPAPTVPPRVPREPARVPPTPATGRPKPKAPAVAAGATETLLREMWAEGVKMPKRGETMWEELAGYRSQGGGIPPKMRRTANGSRGNNYDLWLRRAVEFGVLPEGADVSDLVKLTRTKMSDAKAADAQLRGERPDLTPEEQAEFDRQAEEKATGQKPLFGGTPGATVASARMPLPGAKAPAPASVKRALASPEVTQAAVQVNRFADSIRRTFAPQGRTPEAGKVADIVRANAATLAQKAEAAKAGLSVFRKAFNKMSWEAKKQFIVNMEAGNPQATPELTRAAEQIRKLLDDRRDAIQALGTGKLGHFLEDYFPHIWEDPAKAKSVFSAIFGKRSLGGPGLFLKHRTIPTFEDGLRWRVYDKKGELAGSYDTEAQAKAVLRTNLGGEGHLGQPLKPVSDNPVELALLKTYEMDRYIMGQTILKEMKEAGLAKFVYATAKGPDGYTPINDRVGTVYGKGEVGVGEAFDLQQTQAIEKLIEDLGLEHERKVKIGGQRWGYAQGREMVTKFGGPFMVRAHELGHLLDFKYDLWRFMTFEVPVKGPRGQVTKKASAGQRIQIGKELRALADARQVRKEYARNKYEKMAVMLESYLHAPELLNKTAPTVAARFNEFIDGHPDVAPLRDIRPGVQLGTSGTALKVPGVQIMGRYWAPEPVARVLNNYLAPGLRGDPWFNAIRGIGNNLNMATLGLSGFHFGFTSAESMISKTALALEYASRGHPLKAARLAVEAQIPGLTPIMNIIRGHEFIKAYRTDPNLIQDPVLRQAIGDFISSGGRVTMDTFYHNNAMQNFGKALREAKEGPLGSRIKGGGKLARNTLGGFLEATSFPIMQWLVPRQKVGVFLDLARMENERLGPNATEAQRRAVMGKAWDSVDNRMGQLVYDNLFVKRTLKDLGFLSVRSLGWNLGTYREIGGAALDLASIKRRIKAGEPWMTHRMAYVPSLVFTAGLWGAITQYLFTGKGPEELKDYFYPKTGGTRPDGTPERVSLPTYVKDAYGYQASPVTAVSHKIHPLITLTVEMLQNEDFYGTEIRHPDDPLAKQAVEAGEYLAKQYVPFSVRNIVQRREAGESWGKSLSSMIGVVPAPAGVNRTKAENVAFEVLRENMRRGSRTKAEAEAARSRARYRQDIRQGKRPEIPPGTLTPRQVRDLYTSAKQEPLVRITRSFTVDQMEKVYEATTDKEKAKLRRPYIEKIIRKLRAGVPDPDERKKMQERLRELRRALAAHSEAP